MRHLLIVLLALFITSISFGAEKREWHAGFVIESRLRRTQTVSGLLIDQQTFIVEARGRTYVIAHVTGRLNAPTNKRIDLPVGKDAQMAVDHGLVYILDGKGNEQKFIIESERLTERPAR